MNAELTDARTGAAAGTGALVDTSIDAVGNISGGAGNVDVSGVEPFCNTARAASVCMWAETGPEVPGGHMFRFIPTMQMTDPPLQRHWDHSCRSSEQDPYFLSKFAR